MDEESAVGQHIKRAVALLVGCGIGLLLVYLLVAITAGSRRGTPIAVDDKNLAPSALQTPFAAAAMPAATTGEEIFVQRCAPCHGPKGHGNGLLAPQLTTEPRDLVKGPYWIRSTAAGTAPVRDDLKKVVERGISGTMMPGFEGVLEIEKAEQQGIDLVVDYLIAQSKYLQKPGTVIEPEEQATGEDWEVEAGKAVWDALKCAECHGDGGRGGGARAAEIKDGRGQAVRVPDLSAPWDFRRGSETHHIWMGLELGLSPEHMPSLTSKTSKGDRLALAVYVRSLARKLLDSDDMKAAREQRGLVRHGEDMVHLLGCARCHTPVDANGLPRRDLAFAGGVEIRTPSGTFHAGNLTPHPEHGIGKASDENLARAITEGVSLDGRSIDPLAHPWTWYSKLTSSDLAAIIAYLRSLPVATNAVSAAERESRGIFSMLGVMFGAGEPAVEVVSRIAGASPETPGTDGDEDAEEEDPTPADTSAAKPGATDNPPSGTTVATPKGPPAAGTDSDDEGGDDDDDAPQSSEARLAVAKARVEEANLRLSEAAAAFGRAKAEYEKVQAEVGAAGDDKSPGKGKKKKKKKKKKRR
ncbi:MAG: c-type cytochrome [Pseudomonadota bacterium]